MIIKASIKPLIILLIITSFSLLINKTHAQRTKAILTFKDGTTKTGLGKIIGNDVKFKTNKKDKAIKYNFTNLESVKIYSNSTVTTYVSVKVKGFKEPVILQPLRQGKVNLYEEITVAYRTGGFMNNGFGNTAYSGVGYAYNINNFYVKKENETEAFHLGSNQLFSKNFKLAASTYFKDCPELVKKIESKEFKKKHIKEIVEFYNKQCD